MKILIASFVLALGSVLPLEKELFTNSVNVVVGLHENVEIRINWSNAPLNTLGEVNIKIYDSAGTLRYNADHDQALVSVSHAGWPLGTCTIVTSATGFEELDYLSLE